MFRFAANISTMFAEWAFHERIKAAAGAGFKAVECQWPYDTASCVLAGALAEAGLVLVLMNAPKDDGYGCGDGGSSGMAALPGYETRFRHSIDTAMGYAETVACDKVHVLAGVPDRALDHGACRDIYIENIRWAADQMASCGMTVMLEAINRKDLPGYHLTGNGDLARAIADIDRPNVRMQFDVYHAYRSGENPVETLDRYAGLITHVQVSGFPGRHEPVGGAIDFPAVFSHLRSVGYRGWVGCEYRPESTTIAGLDWMDAYAQWAR